MHVRMLLIEVTCDEKLCVPDAHPFHVFKDDACHYTIGQPCFILFGETQRNVSDGFHNLAVHL